LINRSIRARHQSQNNGDSASRQSAAEKAGAFQHLPNHISIAFLLGCLGFNLA
jgi:hypothetical protein